MLAANSSVVIAPINGTVVQVLRCPADPAGIKIPPAGANQGYHINYVLCHGNGSAVSVAQNSPAITRFGLDNNGLFYGRSAIKLVTVTDGTSNTIAVSEILLSNLGTASDGDVRGRAWNAIHAGATFSTIFPPNSTIGDYPQGRRCVAVPNAPCAASNTNGVYLLARSGHSGGVNACMADGSARFFSNGITPSAWLAIGTRAGGETVSLD